LRPFPRLQAAHALRRHRAVEWSTGALAPGLSQRIRLFRAGTWHVQCRPMGTSALLFLAFSHAPYLQNVTPNSITVVWQTQASEVGSVHFTPMGGTEQVLSDSSATTNHAVTLTNLSPSTRYSYFVSSPSSGQSIAAELHTAPTGNEPFTFLVYGDNRRDGATGSDTPHQQVVARMQMEAPDFIIQTG